jgi:hypothetical protein
MNFNRGNSDSLVSMNIGKITKSEIVIGIYIHSTFMMSATSYLSEEDRLNNKKKAIKILSNLNKYKRTAGSIFLKFEDGFYSVHCLQTQFNTEKIKYFYFDGEYYDIPFNNPKSHFMVFSMFKELNPFR